MNHQTMQEALKEFTQTFKRETMTDGEWAILSSSFLAGASSMLTVLYNSRCSIGTAALEMKNLLANHDNEI